jgi:glutamyl-tRNA reductase
VLGNTILCVGLNHTTAPLPVQEQAARFVSQAQTLHDNLAHVLAPTRFPEYLSITTCNRTEIYCVTGEGTRAADTLRHNLAHDFPTGADARVVLYEYTDRPAVTHLFEVAAGLDSLVLGEFEILGQLRRAYQTACARGTLGPILHKLFQSAARTGKRARSETDIGRGAQTIAYAAVELARRHFGNLAGRAALVIGAGAMGERAARHLHQHGACRITVASRTHAHAAQLACRVGGNAITLQDLERASAEADLVICATRAPQPVLPTETLARVMRTRAQRPLCLIDISMPRNIEPSASTLPNVVLCNLDDLHHVVAHTHATRAAAIAQVREIVSAQVDEFWQWHRTRRAAPVLDQLYTRVESIRQAELEKALRRLNHLALTDRERSVLNALTTGLVNKIFAAPTANLKAQMQNGDGQVYLDTLRALFDLQTESFESWQDD